MGTTGGDDDDETSNKLLIAFGIAIVSFVSAIAPMKIIKVDEHFFSAGNLLASGVLLSGGLVHQLPESISKLERSLQMKFPIGPFVAGLTFCGFLILEEYLHSKFSHGHDDHHHDNNNSHHGDEDEHHNHKHQIAGNHEHDNTSSHHHHDDGSYHLDDSNESAQHVLADHAGATVALMAAAIPAVTVAQEEPVEMLTHFSSDLGDKALAEIMEA